MHHVDYCEIDFWDGYFRMYCVGVEPWYPHCLEYLVDGFVDMDADFDYPVMSDRQVPGESVNTIKNKFTVFEDIWHGVYNPARKNDAPH
jgi:hypothetical protein